MKMKIVRSNYNCNIENLQYYRKKMTVFLTNYELFDCFHLFLHR